MGSDNLNRVFIKAYGKGGTNSAAGNEATASQELMVRFDTATVQIPAPHILMPPRQAARPANAPLQSPQPAQATLEVLPSATANTETGAELTQWDQTMMSILFGGSTMVAPSTSIHAVGRQTVRSQHSPSDFVPKPSMSPSVSQGSTSPELTTPKSSEAIQSPAAPNAPITPLAATSSKVVAGPQASKPTVPEASSADSEVSKAELTQKTAAMNRGGEIFRLDRPSYADTASSMRTPMAVDNFDSEESSQTAFDIELNRSIEDGVSKASDPSVFAPTASISAAASMPAPSRASTVAPTMPFGNPTIGPSIAPHSESTSKSRSRTMEKTKRREQGLRQARIKIFNPLWEVDRLEWPAVCSELSKTIDEGAAGVVDNLLRACQAGLQVLAVTSPQSGEGTSTVACCLAMLAGKHGLNIALVDSNIENPSLSYQTNLDLEVDWNDAVSKRLPLEEIAVHSVDDQVTLVPLLERLNAPELNDQNVAMMLQELSQSFDLVIVDLGHMSSQGNLVRKLGEHGVINAVVAVVDRRLSSPERIEMCLRQIRQTGIASIGLVENFAA